MRHRQLLGALSGVVAPPLLLAVLLLVTALEWSFLRASGWSAVARGEVGWPSILGLSDLGWVIATAFVACGLLGIGFAASLYRVLPTSSARLAALLLGLVSVALALVAFEAGPPGANETWHNRVHGAAYPIIPLGAAAAAALLAYGLWNEEDWRRQARVALAALAVIVPTFLLTGFDALGQLARFLLFGGLLLWIELLALGLLRRHTSAQRVRGVGLR